MSETQLKNAEAILADSQIPEYRRLLAENASAYQRYLSSKSEADRQISGKTADQMLVIERALASKYGVNATDISGIVRAKTQDSNQ